jgi:imidazole glycerol-phosphate synthase subunit HisH
MLALVDLQISNLRSVLHALERVGVTPTVTTDAEAVARADVVVLPGVGSFRDGMRSLRDNDLVAPLREHATAGKPLLGICLGMQLLADHSDEHGSHEGLALIPGSVRRLPQTAEARVPNIGWSDVVRVQESGVFPQELSGAAFYFVHSYHLVCEDPSDVVAEFDFGPSKIAAVVQRNEVVGMQFHPEKSQEAGLDLLKGLLADLSARAGR